MDGWVCIHRKILEWEWFDDASTFRLFMYLVISANHKAKKWRGITIERGEHLTSLESLSSKTGLTISQIRTSLRKLKSTGDIASKTSSKNTVITIVNYDSYQSDSKRSSNQIAIKSQTNDKRVTTNNNENNENNENNKRKRVSQKLDYSCWPSMPSEQVLADWLAMRKRLKANVTQTVINRLAKQLSVAAQSGLTVDECLSECVVRNWRGFEYEWVKGRSGNPNGKLPTADKFISGKF